MVSAGTAEEAASSRAAAASPARGRSSRQLTRPTSHIPVVSTTAPANCHQSPRKYPASTSRVPAGTLSAAQRAGREAGSARQTSPATSAAVKPAQWKCGTVSARTCGSKPNSGWPERSATRAPPATEGAASAVSTATSAGASERVRASRSGACRATARVPSA